MHAFAGSITFEGSADIGTVPFHTVRQENSDRTNYFLYGKTPFAPSKEIIDFVAGMVANKILSVDVSIDTEDRIRIHREDAVNGRYSFVAIHGKEFDEALAISKTLSGTVIATREAETSDKLG